MARNWRRIAVIRPCCIGDAVFALPTIAALREAAPDARIDVWTGQHSVAIHRLHAVADDVRVMPDVPGVPAAAGLARRIVASGADCVVLLDRSRILRTALRATLGAHRTLVAMQPDASPQGHEIDRFLDVLEPLGAPVASRVPHLPRAGLPEREASAPPVVVMHIGGGGNPGTQMASKQWPVAHIAGAIDMLHVNGWNVTLLGGPEDALRVPDILRQVQRPPQRVSVGDGDLDASIAVIASAQAYIGPDTGLTHVAAALGVRTVAIFGPTNPERYAPRGASVGVLAPPSAWSLQHGDLRRSAGGTHSAESDTSQITPDMVVAAVDALCGAEVA